MIDVSVEDLLTKTINEKIFIIKLNRRPLLIFSGETQSTVTTESKQFKLYFTLSVALP